MGDDEKTPRYRTRPPTAICPHCRKPKEVTVAGLLVLHTVQGKWSRSMCRGSGQPAVLPRKSRGPRGGSE
jgi:hypothetical protein